MNVYDFDKTIYNGDSTIDFYLFALRRNPLLIRYLPTQIGGFVLYYLGKIDKTQLKEKFFRFARGVNCEKSVVAFWKRNKKKIAHWYMEQQKEDDVVISASPVFLLQPICHQLGIRHLIASETDPSSGKFLSANCYGTVKVERWKETFGECRIDNFYSDSLSDLPMAKLADHAFLIVKGQPQQWNTNNSGKAEE